MEVSWHSAALHTSYDVVGWLAFLTWSISFYPQIILNYRRKSVVGMNFDYMVLNLVKQTWYFVYNFSLYFSSTVQKQYAHKYGEKEMIPVAVNDVAFSAHAVLLSAVPVFQIAIYQRGGQKVSKISIGIMLIMWSSIAVCFFIALPNHRWLWLIYILNVMQVILTVIKYIPQAVMNFLRKSTEGWSIGFTLLDFAGSAATYGQMVLQSIDQGSWKNISGNIGKVMVALVSILFDIIFFCQHYCLYPAKHNKSETSPEGNSKPLDQALQENNV